MHTDVEARERIASSLRGRMIEQAFVGAGSILMLELSSGQEHGRDEMHSSVSVECVWRLRRAETLLTTWRDMAGERRGLCLDTVHGISGAAISSVVFGETLSDFTMTLNDDVQVDVLVDISDVRESECNYYVNLGASLYLCGTDGFLHLEEQKSVLDP